MAKKYEYLMATFRQEELLDNLKSDGEKGWELCSATKRRQDKYINIGTTNMQAVGIEMYVDCIFKREKEEVSPQPTANDVLNSGWEIVEYWNSSLRFSLKASDTANDSYGKKGYEHLSIHSVKRLSDGEIFSVGDKISWDCFDYAHEINEFEITTYIGMRAKGRKPNEFNFPFSQIIKIPPTPRSQTTTIQNTPHTFTGDKKIDVVVEQDFWDATRYAMDDKGSFKRYGFKVYSDNRIDEKLHAIKEAIEKILNS